MTDQLELLESFGPRCSIVRYTVPVEAIEALQYEGSKYSPEFEVGGVGWRLHLQQRSAPQTNEVFLAIHLQCLSSIGAYAHFRLTVCNRDPNNAKSKTFHCHFKKSGSAWGLHHFIPLDRLLNKDYGYVDEKTDLNKRFYRRIAIDAVINVLEAGSDGSYALGSLPQSTKTFFYPPDSQLRLSPPRQQGSYIDATGNQLMLQQGSGNQSAITQGQSFAQQGSGFVQSRPALTGSGASFVINDSPVNTQHVKAPLVYPFEHLEALCDMFFDVNGVRIKAHRCVIASRMANLIPPEMMPLREGITIAISDSLEVFTAFLRYVYTEDYPEQGVLRPESILDLYLLAARCEFYDLCGVCLKYVRPLLTPDNILPIVLTKYSIGDEVLNSLYIRILMENYDVLIQDKQFEEIPGHLFRRLSLILRDKERLPVVNIPATRNTLGRQLATLAESGEYADYEIKLAPDVFIPAHKYLLASRSVVYSHLFSPKGANVREPIFDNSENLFSFRSWQKFLASLYRRTLGDTSKDLSAEDIALIFKMHSVLTLDGQLKREAELNITPTNALRVLIYAVKHNVSELRDRAMTYVSSNFHMLVRQDPQAWDLIADLPQQAVVTLFRTVVECR